MTINLWLWFSILVSGILDIGTQTDEKTGFVSRVRLQDGKFKYA